MPASFTWQPGPSGGTPTNAANLNKLAVTADIGTAGTPTGDAARAAFDARYMQGPAVSPPSGFPGLSVLPMPTIYRLGSGRFLTKLDINALKPPTGVTYYTAPGASAGASGTSASTPIQLSAALGKSDIGTLIYAPGVYRRTESFVSGLLTRSINHLASSPGVQVTGWEPGTLTWTLQSGNIYQTTRSATLSIVDVQNLTAWGDYTQYQKVANLAAITQAGQWAIVGSTVYVWPIGNTNLSTSSAVADAQIRLGISSIGGVYAGAGSTHYVRGIDFCSIDGGGSGGLFATAGATVIAQDCTVKYTTNNGAFQTQSGNMIAVRCTASSNFADGFNYGQNVAATLAEFIEIDCNSHHNGLQTPGTNNASTSHEAVRGIRVACTYDQAGGPVVCDVNSAQTWNLGCSAGNSTLANSASWAVDATSKVTGKGSATMWLDRCTASSAPYAFLTFSGDATGAIHLHGCSWTNAKATNPSDVGKVDFYDAT